MFNKLTLFQALLILQILPYKMAMASDFHSPRTEALGGAGHASPLLSDAIYLNPSFTSFMQAHSLSFNYLTYSGGTLTTPSGVTDYYGHDINISVLDGTSESLFQAGIGYTRREDSSLIHVGASKAIAKQYGVGMGGKFIFPNDNSGDRISDASLSVTDLFNSWFQTALIVDNLFESGANRGFLREFILGTKFNITSILLIYIDPHWIPTVPGNESSLGYEAGVEFPFFSDLFLRIGSFRNSTIPHEAARGDGYALGFGWLAPRLSLDYSFSRVTTPIFAFAHNFGFTIYF